jgi:hypothetical protein
MVRRECGNCWSRSIGKVFQGTEEEEDAALWLHFLLVVENPVLAGAIPAADTFGKSFMP